MQLAENQGTCGDMALFEHYTQEMPLIFSQRPGKKNMRNRENP